MSDFGFSHAHGLLLGNAGADALRRAARRAAAQSARVPPGGARRVTAAWLASTVLAIAVPVGLAAGMRAPGGRLPDHGPGE